MKKTTPGTRFKKTGHSTPVPFQTSPSPYPQLKEGKEDEPISERESHSENVSDSSVILYEGSEYYKSWHEEKKNEDIMLL